MLRHIYIDNWNRAEAVKLLDISGDALDKIKEKYPSQSMQRTHHVSRRMLIRKLYKKLCGVEFHRTAVVAVQK